MKNIAKNIFFNFLYAIQKIYNVEHLKSKMIMIKMIEMIKISLRGCT